MKLMILILGMLVTAGIVLSACGQAGPIPTPIPAPTPGQQNEVVESSYTESTYTNITRAQLQTMLDTMRAHKKQGGSR